MSLETGSDIMETPLDNPSARRRPLLLMVLGLALFVSLPLIMGLNPSMLLDKILSVQLWVFCCLALLQTLIIFLGSWKWCILLKALPMMPIRLSFRAAVGGTTLGTLLGQILPIQVVTPAARAWIGKRHNIPLGRSVGSSLYEQLFELITLIGAATVSGLVFFSGIDFAPAFVFATVVFIAIAGAVRPTLRWVSAACGQIKIEFLEPRLVKLQSAFREAADLPTAALRILMSISILRYGLMTALNIWLLWLLVPDLPLLTAIVAYPLVLAVLSLPMIPGGLGVVEFTWSGILIAAGVDAGLAVEAALALRIISTAAFLIIAPFLLVLGLLRPAEAQK